MWCGAMFSRVPTSIVTINNYLIFLGKNANKKEMHSTLLKLPPKILRSNLFRHSWNFAYNLNYYLSKVFACLPIFFWRWKWKQAMKNDEQVGTFNIWMCSLLMINMNGKNSKYSEQHMWDKLLSKHKKLRQKLCAISSVVCHFKLNEWINFTI